MILWTVKLVSSFRRAIAGRKYPHQLAWAVAFGLLLGVVPHGNLLAIVLLLVVLSLKINHAMAGLTAVGATFLATRLDPYSHQVGDYLLTHPRFSQAAADAWQLPLVPWTDLNNTVVLGSFLIGVGALVPVFAITYPVFRLFAPSKAVDDDKSVVEIPNDVRRTVDGTHQVLMVDQGHAVTPPHQSPRQAAGGEGVEFVEVDRGRMPSDDGRVAVETRIDVIRMKNNPGGETSSSDASAIDEQQPMDEALNYLLRQLRDSQQRKAA